MTASKRGEFSWSLCNCERASERACGARQQNRTPARKELAWLRRWSSLFSRQRHGPAPTTSTVLGQGRLSGISFGCVVVRLSRRHPVSIVVVLLLGTLIFGDTMDAWRNLRGWRFCGDLFGKVGLHWFFCFMEKTSFKWKPKKFKASNLFRSHLLRPE